MISHTKFNLYLSNFRREFSQYLKSGVGLQIIVFPFRGGCLLIVNVDNAIPAKDEFRKNSRTLSEAFSKTNLFDSTVSDINIPGTSIILFQNKIILIKNEDDEQWNENAIKKDIKNIISKLTDK